MKENVVPKIYSVLEKENNLRKDLIKIYNELRLIVEEEDEIIKQMGLYETPKHLEMLNLISKELKLPSYIPHCIIINSQSLEIIKNYTN